MPEIKLKPKIFPKYAEYKDSGIDWLGKIPKDWNIKKLKYNFKYEKGGKAAEYTAEFISEHHGEYPVYSGQTEHGGIMGLVNRYDYDFRDEAIFSTTVGAKVMTPTIIKGKFCLSQNCLLMVKKSDQVIPRFFFYQLIPLFRKEKDLVPSHMQPSMRFSDLDTYFSAYPAKEEQAKTADFLDKETEKIDKLVEKKQKLIELLKEERTALISQAVTKGVVKGFMFDTHIFDELLDGGINIEDLPTNHNYYITHIQRDEIEKIGAKKGERREKLLALLEKLAGNKLPTESAVLDVSSWDEAKFSKETSELPTESFILGLSVLGAAKLGSGSIYKKLEIDNPTHIEDALIGETAIENGLILVTNEKAFRNRAIALGGNAISYGDFIKGEYVKMKDSGIPWLGQIPEHWEVKKIKHISEIILGKMLQNDASTANDKYKPYLKAQNIRWESVDVLTVDEMWFKPAETEQYRLRKFDLLVSEGGEVGRTSMWLNELEECYIQNSVNIVRVFIDKADKKFYLYFMMMLGSAKLFEAVVNRVSIAHLTREKLKEIQVVLPPRQEQLDISKHIDERSQVILQSVNKIEQQIEKIKEYRTALISATVTGKIKII